MLNFISVREAVVVTIRIFRISSVYIYLIIIWYPVAIRVNYPGNLNRYCGHIRIHCAVVDLE